MPVATGIDVSTLEAIAPAPTGPAHTDSSPAAGPSAPAAGPSGTAWPRIPFPTCETVDDMDIEMEEHASAPRSPQGQPEAPPRTPQHAARSRTVPPSLPLTPALRWMKFVLEYGLPISRKDVSEALVRRCPACFGPREWGRSVLEFVPT